MAAGAQEEKAVAARAQVREAGHMTLPLEKAAGMTNWNSECSARKRHSNPSFAPGLSTVCYHNQHSE